MIADDRFDSGDGVVNRNQVAQQCGQHDDLQEQFEAARQEAVENHDRYLRALAESENMRKRLERLCDERVWQEKKRLLTHILDLANQLEQALEYVDGDDPVGVGVRLTYQQLQQVLAQEGVRALQSVGQAFDPRIHEAVEMSSGSGERNGVTGEFRKGYMLDGRLLRPARVRVERMD